MKSGEKLWERGASLGWTGTSRRRPQMTLVSKKEDLLGLLEEIPSSEAAFLPDMSQRRGVVDSP
jgi:hypothetical protein